MGRPPSTQRLRSDIAAFLDANISSVAELEVLLAIHRAGPEGIEPARLSRELSFAMEFVGSCVESLTRHDLVTDRDGCLSVLPVGDLAPGALLAELEATYRARKVAVVAHIIAPRLGEQDHAAD